MFYPQDTVEELGATEILPCTQYWMNDNAPEENFPTSGRTVGTALSQIEDLDERAAARAATLADLGWPEETSPTRLVVPAGSIGITHFDVYHRGTHRSAGPDMDKRIMIKLWYFRARDNDEPSWDHTPAEDDDAPLAFRTDAGIRGGQEPIWTRMWHWMKGNGVTKGDAPVRAVDEAELASLTTRLEESAGGLDAAKIEPSRVGAAYALALAGEQGAAALERAFVDGSPLYPASLAQDPSTYGDFDPATSLKVDGVERSAAYGLAALPAYGGVPALTKVAADPLTNRNKRALALHALGQCAPTGDATVLRLLSDAVSHPESVFIQSTAAAALGFLGRRAAAERNLTALSGIVAALLPPLDVSTSALQSNGHPSPDLAEGINGPEDPTTVDAAHPAATPQLLNFPADGVMPRSATREMAAYALTMTCAAAGASGACTEDAATWTPAVEWLAAAAHTDLNRFSMGFAAECLHRLAEGGLECAQHALDAFVASPRWKPPELAGHLRLTQDQYDYDQGLFVQAK